jgi:hypothetical protein
MTVFQWPREIPNYSNIHSQWNDYQNMKIGEVEDHLEENNFHSKSLTTKNHPAWSVGFVALITTVLTFAIGTGLAMGFLNTRSFDVMGIIFAAAGGIIVTQLIVAGVCRIILYRHRQKIISQDELNQIAEELNQRRHISMQSENIRLKEYDSNAEQLRTQIAAWEKLNFSTAILK